MKSQCQNPKSQTISKFKSLNPKQFGILNIKYLNLFGIWKLGFGIFFLVIGYLLLAPASANAATDTLIYTRQLTSQEASAGFSAAVPAGDFSVVIEPGAFNRAATIEIYQPQDTPALPKDKTLISPLYFYAVLPTSNNQLAAAITLKFSYPATETRWREIFLYQDLGGRWQRLPSAIDSANHLVAASTTNAAGRVGVFADHLDKNEFLKEKINSPSILVVDAKTGEVLVERNSAVKRPMASLTKLMTASVFLDNNPGWNKIVTMQKQDDAIGARLNVKPDAKITTRDLFFATLVASANNAAKALARSTGLTQAEFVKKMNAKAKMLGMDNTTFVEPTGLDQRNQTTAQDYLKLSKKTLSQMLFLQATTSKKYTVTDLSRKRKITIVNTNKILGSSYVVTGSKTGFTDEAGRCLMIKARNRAGREVFAIIMGADKPGAHWTDMNLLLDAALGGSY